ncbi:hypothetical protein G7046_g6573 [Stylonectria norvegica]|nr:hypothetical protein G7046_g6573 [Stylonectria norvegica]
MVMTVDGFAVRVRRQRPLPPVTVLLVGGHDCRDLKASRGAGNLPHAGSHVLCNRQEHGVGTMAPKVGRPVGAGPSKDSRAANIKPYDEDALPSPSPSHPSIHPSIQILVLEVEVVGPWAWAAGSPSPGQDNTSVRQSPERKSGKESEADDCLRCGCGPGPESASG